MSDGDVVSQFGQYKGRTVAEVYQDDRGYLRWLMSGKFIVQKSQRPFMAAVFRYFAAQYDVPVQDTPEMSVDALLDAFNATQDIRQRKAIKRRLAAVTA